ncbi:super-infection exclusion protein B [Flavobacterium sp. MAHUQ-51]|uniref:super-infection exclusion protein B n=1 Tax=Flavobacterium sp. GCM10022190 TaxID=3252639 RepID=UPI00360978FC
MNFKFSDLLDFAKIPIKIFILCAIVSGILLFITSTYLSQLNLTEFKKDFGKYFGIIFIVSTSFILLSILYYFVDKIRQLIYKKEFIKEITEDIKNLDPHEKSVLREFIIMRRKAIAMPIDNPIVSALLGKGILVSVSDIGRGLYFSFSISKVVNKHLKDEDLGFNSNNSSNEELKQFLLNNRPSFASDYLYSHFN